MNRSNPQFVESGPLPCLLSVPGSAAPASGVWPLLCFLHGYDEGPPTAIRTGLTRHGPLAEGSSVRAASEFIIVAPQLPSRGDLWLQSADAVQAIVRQVQAQHRGDPLQTFLTGFSYGGNGVFDLALAQRGFWTALWPVDPTRVPGEDPGRPLWLSSGEISRHNERGFVQRLRLEGLHKGDPGDRVYEDQGQDHVGTARHAYGDDGIYGWLLSKRLAAGG